MNEKFDYQAHLKLITHPDLVENNNKIFNEILEKIEQKDSYTKQDLKIILGEFFIVVLPVLTKLMDSLAYLKKQTEKFTEIN